MAKGLNAYEEKKRRDMRRRNHIARDLALPKFRQQVKQGKPQRPPPEIDEWSDELDDK